MTAADYLAEVEARYGEWYDPFVHHPVTAEWPDRDDDETRDHYIVRCDLPRTIAALRAVLDLHKPVRDASLVGLDVDPFWRCSCGNPWPCAEAKRTDRAIEAALGGDF